MKTTRTRLLLMTAMPLITLTTMPASAGRYSVDEETFLPTLEGGVDPSALAANLLNTALHGAHHMPLQMQGTERQAWVTGDFGHNEHFDSDSSLIEVGVSTDLMEKQLIAGLGLGQSWIDQDLRYGGESDMDGQYLLGELSYRASGSAFAFTLTGTYGDWDADIQRNYLSGPDLETSTGSTDVSAAALRLRVDWLDAAQVLGFSINPKLEYTITRTEMDAYSETGGISPASYEGRDETSQQVRYGVTAIRPVLADKALLRLRVEGVHRLDDNDSRVSGSSTGLPGSTFDFDGRGVRQDWVVLGADFDYQLSDALTLTSGVFTSTSSEDPILGTSLGLRYHF